MPIQAKLLTIFLALCDLLSTPSIPKKLDPNWINDKVWEQAGTSYLFESHSDAMVNYCHANPTHYVQFPNVVQGAQELFLDGRLIASFGDTSFKWVRSYYGAPALACNLIPGGKTLTWKAYAYAKFFRQFYQYPVVSETPPRYNAFGEILNVVAAGNLILMALFMAVIFWHKLPLRLNLSLSGASLMLGLYYMGTTAGLVGIQIPMIYVHKFTELTLWLGLSAYFYSLIQNGIQSAKSIYLVLPIIGIGILFILFSPTGNGIQLGSNLPMLPTLACGLFILGSMFLEYVRAGMKRRELFEILSLGSFVVLCMHDVLVVMGFMQGYYLLACGTSGALLFFAFSVNDKIDQTYRERDYLRTNLQAEVTKKTSELTKQTIALQTTMTNLKEAQAELVQSARLASLGTLSAGIAHEINNSLNYVNGGLRPLERLVGELTDEERKTKMLKLTKVMSDGLKLTFDIIKSLRNYTGLNQAQFSDLNLRELVQSVLTIIRSKLGEKHKVAFDIPEDLTLYGSVVGLNQVFMNLISNSIGAMPDGGVLTILAKKFPEMTAISVSDTGEGISSENQARIFEPFFTTKDVGSGTGLGLYIVKREIDRHHGKIQVHSVHGHGTTFEIELPATMVLDNKKAA